MTTALYVLRVVQLGLRVSELDNFTYGEVLDMFTEHSNDDHKYDQLATQDDFDRF